VAAVARQLDLKLAAASPALPNGPVMRVLPDGNIAFGHLLREGSVPQGCLDTQIGVPLGENQLVTGTQRQHPHHGDRLGYHSELTLQLQEIRRSGGASMSLRALSERATWRNTAAPPPAPAAAVAPGEGEPEGGEVSAGSEAELQKAQGALTDSIPTEVLGPYTAIVAIVVANTTAKDSLAAVRWWTYVVSFVFIVAYIVAAYFRNSNRPRKLPWVELLGALLAFAAWGVNTQVMPSATNVCCPPQDAVVVE